MLNFLFSKAHHTWVATPSLLKKISDVIANDQYLQKYAQPSQEETEIQAQALNFRKQAGSRIYFRSIICSDVQHRQPK